MRTFLNDFILMYRYGFILLVALDAVTPFDGKVKFWSKMTIGAIIAKLLFLLFKLKFQNKKVVCSKSDSE